MPLGKGAVGKGQLTLVFFSLHVAHPLEGFPQYTILADCKFATGAVPNSDQNPDKVVLSFSSDTSPWGSSTSSRSGHDQAELNC